MKEAQRVPFGKAPRLRPCHFLRHILSPAEGMSSAEAIRHLQERLHSSEDQLASAHNLKLLVVRTIERPSKEKSLLHPGWRIMAHEQFTVL